MWLESWPDIEAESKVFGGRGRYGQGAVAVGAKADRQWYGRLFTFVLKGQIVAVRREDSFGRLVRGGGQGGLNT